jgi:hypothetical protein
MMTELTTSLTDDDAPSILQQMEYTEDSYTTRRGGSLSDAKFGRAVKLSTALHVEVT